MLQRLLLITLTLCSLSATAQWQQTGSKVRYVNGLGIPTKDTAAGVSADSSQIVIRPQDSALYIKYKRTWLRVGGGGGSIAGSGTTNYIPKFTSATAIGNSQIFDNGTNVGIGTITPSYKLNLSFTQSSNTFQGFNINATTIGKNYSIFSGNATGGGLYGLTNPFTGFVHYTDAAALSYINDGSGYFSWHNSSAELMRLTNGGNVGIGTASPAAKLNIETGGAVTLIKQTAASLSNGVYALDIDNLAQNSNMSTAGAFRIQTNTNSNSFIVNGLGNVGIGTASPAAKLDVATGDGISAIFSNANGAGNFNSIELRGGTIGTAVNWQISKDNTTANAFQLIPSTTAGGTTYTTPVLTITSTGNTGIGYTAPAATLAVQGTTLINTNTDNGVDKLQVNGSISGIGFKQAYVAKTGAYTATTSDYFIDCTSGSFTVTLYAASGNAGRILIVKNSGAGSITLDGNASETIDGSTTFSLLVQYDAVQIMCDGTNWKIISKL